ncbi:MAG TPA: thioredoxin fold domain-containing protein, partial [candidate division Zixibacteria bacterium]|nr:thioredoxin fold domain-containing protein [candidate division Zixibacteria bacterium]
MPHTASLFTSSLGRRICVGLSAAVLSALTVSLVFAGETKTPDKQGAAEATEGIVWLQYEDGLKKAFESEKQILIDFTTKTCGWCRRMEREAFVDSQVVDYVNAHFVPIKVWGDSPRELEIDGFTTSEMRIAREIYRVRGYPTFWFLESDGKKIGQQPGYQQPNQFISLLEFVKERKYEQ